MSKYLVTGKMRLLPILIRTYMQINSVRKYCSFLSNWNPLSITGKNSYTADVGRMTFCFVIEITLNTSIKFFKKSN